MVSLALEGRLDPALVLGSGSGSVTRFNRCLGP